MHDKLQGTSKNSFLSYGAEDFGSEKVMKKPEYFVYCGFSMAHFWDERFAPGPKGEFLEVPYNLSVDFVDFGLTYGGGLDIINICLANKEMFRSEAYDPA